MGKNRFSVFQVADRSTSKVINQRSILDMIYTEDGISKASLAKELGISKPAVSSNVAELVDKGIVLETGEGDSSTNGGRKPIMLHFNYKYKHIGIVDLSFREPMCAVCDLQGKLYGTRRITLHRDATDEERKQNFHTAMLAILAENKLRTTDIGVLVFSQPGIVDETGLLYSEAKHHMWADLNLPEYLKDIFQVPILVKNDVNLAAVGELNFGYRTDNLVYITCGVGLGAGIIINGQPFEGDSYAAGEIGDVILENGRRLEDSVAMESLLQHETSFMDIIDGLRREDDKIKKLVREKGQVLGRAIYNLCVSLDIKTAIFGGEYLELGDDFIFGLKDGAKGGRLEVEIRQSVLGESAGIYGGFVLGKDKIFEVLAEGK